MLRGIDVSEHDGAIDWPQVAQHGEQFAVIRSSYGLYSVDERFAYNYEQAGEAGLLRGVYHYSYALNDADARAEANHVLSVLGTRRPTMPIWLDMEDADGYKARHGFVFSRQNITGLCAAFLEVIRDNGRPCGVYANEDWLTHYIDVEQLPPCDVWLAQWSAKPTYTGRYEMWQYASTGRVPGIPTNVDLDLCYKNYRKEPEMTQEEFNRMFDTALNGYLAAQEEKAPSRYAVEAWADAKKQGIMDGTAPRSCATREQLAVVLDRLGLLDK
ncbi:glycoside hydrolase family 25 protein [Butyricicoccus faecihominis]|uniref:glycoside hydrolase family 25 protein n=1 Tax=Butyricicoccus faecihominis TaxID=1712515 RepID=UPI002479DB7F|nr:glycoside hydrolase family 25 protein [Butyricicoccus faecihominis]MCQ5130874.1 glycoside hydrolase family 25 protein [Butyricicoccus faecihominis]MCQ5130909.1 glycoside hydrolase family 25 protein [Butyricicoccus faecihominis]